MAYRSLVTAVMGAIVLSCGGSVVLVDTVNGGSGGGSGGASGGMSGVSGDASASSASSSSGSPGTTGEWPKRLSQVTKVDVLFDVDNSRSMTDKQGYLVAAIPDLVNRLLNPNCLDEQGTSHGASNGGTCADGLTVEFPPVNDLHLGMVSSSLGPRGGDLCLASAQAPPPFSNLPAHNDDQAHLLARTLTYSSGGSSATEGTAADTTTLDPYLYWFPASFAGAAAGPGNPVPSPTVLVQDFTAMVGGAGAFGCGIESQLESWYRFLIQPEPYSEITISGPLGGATGAWDGVDTTILQQRHDFLRTDSAVLIVDLSDENDSEIDVRSIGGLGVNWMASTFQPPAATSACATNPASPACQSCAVGQNANTDAACKAAPSYTATNDWGYDANLRHVHMKAKYGVDVQFPIARYLNGLTSAMVPDRDGEYPSGATSYVGQNDCQNPLFAGALPDGSRTDVQSLCHAPPGPRTPDLVFYAHIGGVPHQLLHFKAGDPAASTLTAADWVKIVGKDPESYDYTGIDPHMIESVSPRPGLPAPGSSDTADPITGHEWITDTGAAHVFAVDIQYACTFPLVDATGVPAPRDCTQLQNAYECDCPGTASLTSAELPPICDPTTQTIQIGAKAYPTVRELLLAEKLGTQGVVASICPIDVADNATHDDPLFGYRPAVEMIGDRLRTALTPQ
jgi:hypothetical protein